ncbi:adenylate/guanylate cyclase domain-containing protein [Rhizobium rhizogenes]|uniref:adenylate/guanylate cyclase domain-containing protein n=1 Tax=Rhizobium rhizogenes TaxID=359 RepID=UPI0004D92CBB|nr:adenylate/guanylate cyclase domain-containing protein [Rhizobium rhizogenes]OCI97910.1 adenylate cyclase [Agrobacterium sp. 13-626]KEA05067.1 adenylate cyclase [Rhizobium rhizogenes]MQB33246.1 adenylate/guanylate cyclase domain-containing protein [Rhizobium rhizogenes]NTG39816.1 adenylate/guanylate cyclase domain-containing protein [Rhizobium rhizogenes]NTI27365.1 adenylate/guanylate cyclase domain-containing protein [Rhizobium rhizogenes]
MSEARSLFGVLRHSARPDIVDAIERLVLEAPDRKLNRVNALAFAAEHGFDEEQVINAFLHASRLGLFEISWNVLCPGCGGVLDANTSLKTVQSETYNCSLCAAGYEPTLDEMVEVTFTISPRVRHIEAHNPHELSPLEYFRQIYWGSGVDLPDEGYEAKVEQFVLESLELPAGEKAVVSLQLPAEYVIIFEPVTHAAQFLDVKGEPSKERQTVSLVFDRLHRHSDPITLRPGPLRILIENHTEVRALPSICVANDALHALLSRRRPFLTAKQLLSNQTFRDIHRTDTIDVDQRLKITSLTFLFTDLRGSTELYERVGDLAAFDLVRTHFGILHEIVAAEAGAVVKTIGDAVMATFPTPDRALIAAMRMREAMISLNSERGNDDLLLKIGIHEGPCIAVSLNERQDYFGQTVNIASRVQHLATSREIFATGSVLDNPRAAAFLTMHDLKPESHHVSLRGITDEIDIFAIP